MLVKFANLWRNRAAAILVALYALCLLAPTAAVAFNDSSQPSHCVIAANKHQSLGEVSIHHDDGMDEGKASHDSNDHGVPGKCCGLFCVSAITLSFELVIGPAPQASGTATLTVEDLFGRSSGRIDRPPRVLPYV